MLKILTRTGGIIIVLGIVWLLIVLLWKCFSPVFADKSTSGNKNSQEVSSAAQTSSPDYIQHFKKSLECFDQATVKPDRKGVLEPVSEQQMESMISALKAALAEARQVDIGHLEQDYQSLGLVYFTSFIEGAKMIVEGHENSDDHKIIEGYKKMAKWTHWYSFHVRELRMLDKYSDI